LKLVDELSPDVLCLQETKVTEKQLPPEIGKYSSYKRIWLNGLKAGHAGTSLWSKTKPLNILYGMKGKKSDDEGRMVTAEFDKFFLVNVCTYSYFILGLAESIFLRILTFARCAQLGKRIGQSGIENEVGRRFQRISGWIG
jgi:hypothetical protein